MKTNTLELSRKFVFRAEAAANV